MPLSDPMVAAVVALGITQITAWGTSYYCLGVLAGPIRQDTGWSRGFVFLGFTVALLVMGLVSSAVGRAIDRRGARSVMTLGTVLVSIGLFALSQARSEAVYLAVWAFLGLGMRLCLYDAAFAALVQVAPSRGRQALSYLTLFGAFASSVFWVVGHALEEHLGWRQTLVVFALINLAICLPLHWFGLARRESERGAGPAGGPVASPDGPPLQGTTRSIAIALFAIWTWLSWNLRRWSLRQDVTGAAECTFALRKYAAGGIYIFAITLTIAAIFWRMSNATFPAARINSISRRVLSTIGMRRQWLVVSG